MEYRCPIHESSKYTCDRPAQYLVSGTAICSYHAAKTEFTSRYFYDKHKSLVDKLYIILDEASQEYDCDSDGNVVQDFQRYCLDWQELREEGGKRNI